MFILISINRGDFRVNKPPDMTRNYKGQDLPEELESLLNEIQSLSNSDEILEIIEAHVKKTKGFKKLNEVTYSFKGFILSSMTQMVGKDAAEKLQFANELNIGSAPRFIDFIEADDLMGVLILQYPDSENSLPISLDEYEERIGAVKEEEKEKFFHDMEILANYGKVHPTALKSPYYWLISPSSGRIILENWRLLTDLEPREEKNILLQIRKNLEILS